MAGRHIETVTELRLPQRQRHKSLEKCSGLQTINSAPIVEHSSCSLTLGISSERSQIRIQNYGFRFQQVVGLFGLEGMLQEMLVCRYRHRCLKKSVLLSMPHIVPASKED